MIQKTTIVKPPRPTFRHRAGNAWRALRGQPHGPRVVDQQAAIFETLRTVGGDRDDPVDNHSWAFRSIRRGDAVTREAGHQKIQEQSAETFLTNGIWQTMFKLPLAYALGDDLRVETAEKGGGAEDVVNEFVTSPGNPIENANIWALRLMLYGELAAPATITDDWGKVRYQMWNPLLIEDVEFFNGDDAQPETVALSRSISYEEGKSILIPTPGEPGDAYRMVIRDHVAREDIRTKKGPGGIWRAIRKREPRHSSRGQFNMGLVNQEQLLDGNLLYYRWDWGVDSRGVPAYLPSLDFARRMNPLMYDELYRIEMLKDHIYTYLMPNKSQEELDAWTKKRQEESANPGSFLAVSVPNAVQAHTPSIQAADMSQFVKTYRDFITTPTGLGPFFYGETALNFATARAQEHPALKFLQHMQARLRSFFELQVQYVLDTAVYHGRLKPTANRDFRIVMPDLSEETFTEKMAALQAMGASFQVAGGAGFAHHEVLADIYQKELERLKLTDVEQTLQAIFGKVGDRTSVPAPPKPAPAFAAPGFASMGDRVLSKMVTAQEDALLDLIRANPELSEKFAKTRLGNRVLQNSMKR